MSKFVACHVTKMWFLKLGITSFRTLKVQGKCWKDDVVTFTAHLSVTIKRLTRYKQQVVLAAMLEGKSMPSNMATSTNHTVLLKNQSAITYFPLAIASKECFVCWLVLPFRERNNFIQLSKNISLYCVYRFSHEIIFFSQFQPQVYS